MKRTVFLPLIMIAFLITGCATNKTLEAFGGSRADAIVKLDYTYGIFERPIVDWQQADATAKKRCMAWGYKNIERFESVRKKCISYDRAGNCMTTQVIVTYQCLDN